MRPRLSTILLICCAVIGSIYTLSQRAAVAPSTLMPMTGGDDRDADRAAIRKHIEGIFLSYRDRDCDAIRAAHAQNWVGFTAFSRTILRGLDEYMKNSARFCVENTPRNPLAMVEAKISDIDYMFYGDVALVPYVAETVYGETARLPGKLRSLDIYAKVNGDWIQVGSHLDLHPDTLALQRSTPGQLSPNDQKALMAAREAAWRAIFSNDRAQLEKIIAPEVIGINASSEQWADRAGVLAIADELGKGGAKLTRLEFPRTETRLYGDIAVLYSTYLYELEMQGETSSQSGRATEIFARRNGNWINTGWHLDSGK